jgi:hypothetical protein
MKYHLLNARPAVKPGVHPRVWHRVAHSLLIIAAFVGLGLGIALAIPWMDGVLEGLEPSGGCHTAPSECGR